MSCLIPVSVCIRSLMGVRAFPHPCLAALLESSADTQKTVCLGLRLNLNHPSLFFVIPVPQNRLMMFRLPSGPCSMQCLFHHSLNGIGVLWYCPRTECQALPLAPKEKACGIKHLARDTSGSFPWGELRGALLGCCVELLDEKLGPHLILQESKRPHLSSKARAELCT